jgi:antitoxin (DNA-binding transcriptional repressor) of toxin-antitoxin stability system
MEAKTHLADFLNRATYAGEGIVVERHSKQIAALVRLNNLQRLEADDNPLGDDDRELTEEARFRSDAVS